MRIYTINRGRVARRAPTAIITLFAALLFGSAPANAATLFSDGFETGNFSAWSQVTTAGDGKAVVQSAIVRTGTRAAQLSESSTSGSKAYVRKTLSSPQADLTASGDFQVRQQGASGGNVPIFRLLASNGTRIVNVYRQNGTSGAIWVGYGGAHFSTSGRLPLSSWANIAVHVIPNGASSTVEVRMNGSLIYRTTNASLGSAGVSTVQIGNDTGAQAFNLVADTITVESGSSTAPSPPANTASPTISGTPEQGRTLTASPGTWSGTQPITYAYRWQRCGSGGTGCASISGATSATYTATSADVGSTLRVAVTASNSAGSSTATSGPTGVVQPTGTQPNLVALWHMDETSGTVMADSVRSHHGTLHDIQLGLAGFSGTAYGFNGTSSYVTVPSASDLNPGSANVAVTIRVKTTAVPNSDWDLIRKGYYTTSGGEFKMEYQSTGQASCGFKGSAGYAELIAGPAINDNRWHTVRCQKTSSAISLIVDGQTFSKSANVGTIANSEVVAIGARPTAQHFKGALDEATIEIG